MQTLTQIPDQISAGTSVEYTRSYTDYPANAGWTLKLILQGAKRLIKSAATNADGKSFDVTLLATETDDLTPGSYSWDEKVTNGTNIKIAASGRLEVLPDVEASAEGTLQLWEEQALAKVEAVIYAKQSMAPFDVGRLSTDLQEYEIAGRRVVKIELPELKKMRDELKAKLKAKLKPGRLVTPVRTTYSGQIRP